MISVLIVALIVVKISHWLYRWSNPKCISSVPPGSMGFPIIGETIDFFKPCGFNEITPFLEKRMLRYGPVFRTNLFGSKTVVSTDPEVNFQIFRHEDISFHLGYSDIFVKIFGKDNLFLSGGDIHKYLKKVTRQLIGAEGLKETLIKVMDRAIHDHLKLKSSQESFDVKSEMDSLVLEYLTPQLISNLKPETEAKLVQDFKSINMDWFQSLLSLASLKGFNKILKQRKIVINVIKDILLRRKESGEKQRDFINTMLEEMEKDSTIFNQGSAISLIFLLICVSKEANSGFTALVIKFICQNPKVLAELKREHKAIVEKRVDKEGGVSWEEYRHNMSFTNMVINEALRMTSATPYMFRKAEKDIEINGYTIPAGWSVVVAPSVVHYDPTVYEDPLTFNPWRWEGKETIWGSKTFMAFGGGARLCIGAEFSRLQIAIYLHHLVTYYDLSLVQDCEITRAPFIQFHKRVRVSISQSVTN